jgi:hypothetical protein
VDERKIARHFIGCVISLFENDFIVIMPRRGITLFYRRFNSNNDWSDPDLWDSSEPQGSNFASKGMEFFRNDLNVELLSGKGFSKIRHDPGMVCYGRVRGCYYIVQKRLNNENDLWDSSEPQGSDPTPEGAGVLRGGVYRHGIGTIIYARE